MNEQQLAQWVSQTRPELSEAVAADIRDHLATLPSRDDIYGYAILPGDPTTSASGGIDSLFVAYNRPGGTGVGPDNDKYCVDDWQHWGGWDFRRSDAALAALNAQFAAAHQADPNAFEIDELQWAFWNSLFDAILDGLATVKGEGLFGQGAEFLAIWISDSSNPILEKSVRRLNSPEVVEEFLREFGTAE